MLINYLRSLVISSIIILFGSIVITLINYFGGLNGTLIRIIEILLPILAIFIGSYFIGKSSSKKGYIEGLKYGGIWVFIFLIINIFAKDIKLLDFVYYIILVMFAVLASMIGINQKKE